MSSYVVRTFLKYSVIFNENTRGESAYLLQEGRIELSKEINGRKKVLAVLTPISMFGEMALLLGDKRRTATAIALDDVKVVEIKKDDFDSFIRESPQIMQTLIDVLVHRLRASTKKALLVPSLFQGICRSLEMLAYYDVDEADYMHTISSLKDAFISTEEAILDILRKLEMLRMIRIETNDKNVKKIKFLHKENFTAEAASRLQDYTR